MFRTLVARAPFAAPVAVAVAATAVVTVNLVTGSAHPTHVLGLSIKPAVAASKGNANGAGSGNANPPAKAFLIAGAISGLAPGVGQTMPLRLQNTNNQAVRVQSLTVTASGGTAACPDTLLMLGSTPTPASGSMTLDLPLGATASTTATTDPLFPVQLSASTPDGCQQFQWTLTFTGKAVQG